jgi:hypothetical protein
VKGTGHGGGLTSAVADDGNGGVTDPAPRPESNAAASRRRWITLGEVLAVIAVLISGLTLWNNWSQRNADQLQKTAEASRTSARSGRLQLVVATVGKRELVLKPALGEQSVQDQRIVFPGALGVSPADTTGEPRIDVTWFEHALIKAREAAHLPDNAHGDAQLPVAITTRFLVDGDERTDVALYDIGYGVSGGWLGGHSITLRGISLIAHVTGDTAQAKLDARWARSHPPARAGSGQP